MSVSSGLDVSVPGRLEEVADGVFAYVQPDGSWMINNTGFLVARDEGVSYGHSLDSSMAGGIFPRVDDSRFAPSISSA